MDNINNDIIALFDSIANKCEDGDCMEALSYPERVFYITQLLEMEVNNGGFSQFFYNSSGNFSNELINAFTQINAFHTVEICKKALKLFGRDLPINRDEREALLDELLTDEIEDILSECDYAFYDYEDDLTKLNYKYILKNKDFFYKD